MRIATLFAFALALSVAGRAQDPGDVERVAGTPAARAALTAIRAAEPATIEDQVRLCEIPAPPLGEAARARAYAAALRGAGLSNVRIDREGNVLGERPGRAARPHLVITAHLDTVFPEGTDVSVTRSGTILRGPGIGDNCRGLAVLLAVARALEAGRVETAGSITFVGTVGEEGLGNLRGVTALVGDTLKGRVDRFVSVDGSGHGITHVAVGSRRYRVTFRGRGGHSYDDFGRANPAYALGRALALIAEMRVPASPRTTFNVGRVGGGTAVNAIPEEAWMEVDLRSTDVAALAAADARLHDIVRRALALENDRRRQTGRLTMTIETIGERPAGSTAATAPIVRTAQAASELLGVTSVLDEGSTDANVAISLGIPAITVGSGGTGTGAHTLHETFDTANSWRGSQRILLLTIALAN